MLGMCAVCRLMFPLRGMREHQEYKAANRFLTTCFVYNCRVGRHKQFAICEIIILN